MVCNVTESRETKLRSVEVLIADFFEMFDDITVGKYGPITLVIMALNSLSSNIDVSDIAWQMSCFLSVETLTLRRRIVRLVEQVWRDYA